MGGIMKTEILIIIAIFLAIIVFPIIIDEAINKFYELKARRDKKHFEQFIKNMKLRGVKHNPDGSCEDLK